jgi:hypothetical protein
MNWLAENADRAPLQQLPVRASRGDNREDANHTRSIVLSGNRKRNFIGRTASGTAAGDPSHRIGCRHEHAEVQRLE